MALENLWTMTPKQEQPALLSKPLVVISSRGERLAQELGFSTPPLVADSADTTALIEAVNGWRRGA